MALCPMYRRFLQDESGLRHGTFRRIHQQQHTIHHVHYAFHFAAKIGMSRRVHDIDFDRLFRDRVNQRNGCILGKDGNSALALKIV